MASSPVCYVHIGAPKTGSTILQKRCFEQRDRLLARGLLYPDVSVRGFGHHDIAFLIGGGYPAWATPQPLDLAQLEAMTRRAIEHHSGSVLLSSEDFYLCPNPGGLRKFLERSGALDGRELRIVVYVRRQDDAHESWFNQTVKAQGYTHDIDTCVREFFDLFDYRLQLSGWEAEFGREALHLRVFDPRRFVGGTLERDFGDALGVGLAACDDGEPVVNISLNRDLLEYQRALNRLPLSPQQKRSLHHSLMRLSGLSKGGGLFDERPYLDRQRREALRAAYATSNRLTARAYLRRDELFADDPLPPDAPPPAAIGLTGEKLAAITGWLAIDEKRNG